MFRWPSIGKVFLLLLVVSAAALLKNGWIFAPMIAVVWVITRPSGRVASQIFCPLARLLVCGPSEIKDPEFQDEAAMTRIGWMVAVILICSVAAPTGILVMGIRASGVFNFGFLCVFLVCGPMIAFGLAGLWSLRRSALREIAKERVRARQCVFCGYDLRACSAHCPECGRPFRHKSAA